ncbi:hypothetical protein ACN47E_009395 [Coniothyrium glycines]
MQCVQSLPRKPILIALALLTLCAVLSRLYYADLDVPLDYSRNHAPAPTPTPTPTPTPAPTETTPLPVVAANDTPQPGYFKAQPEWDWDVPGYASDFNGYARRPDNQNIVLLTASDGGGHNSAIPNVLARVLGDRAKYCEQHGYTNLWLNTSRYDVGDAHRTWSKIPAIAEAFHLHPNAEWVWLLDTDVILMNPAYDLVDEILAPAAIQRGVMRDAPILDGQPDTNPTNINTPADVHVEHIDILITQDHQSINTGSVFFRRSAFTRYILEMMADSTLLMGHEHVNAEQDALKHLMLEHRLVRDHVGIYPQRKFNAYVEGGNNMGYRDGDLLVHFAGCWVTNMCGNWFEEFWEKRGTVGWRPEAAR